MSEGNKFAKGTTTYYVLKEGISTKADKYEKATGLGEKIAETMGEFPEVKADNTQVFVIKIEATDSVTTSVEVTPGTGTYSPVTGS